MQAKQNTPPSSAQIKTERSSNLELYRIIVMLLIVAHHYVVNSGLIVPMNEDPYSANSIFYSIFGAWGKTGINCFVLITGYFMCTKDIALRKFLKLLLWVLTYSVLINFIFIIFGYTPFGIFSMMYDIIPMKTITDGFTPCFLLFYLCIPFLNILIRNMTKQQHLLLISLLLFIYTVHGSILTWSVRMNYVSWFCVLYFISSYLRLYPGKRDTDARFWGTMTLISWTLSIISMTFYPLFIMFRGGDCIGLSYSLISDSNAIFALTNGITSFMWFKNLKIKNSKLINTIAASAFGVLLIHANSDTMRQWLWKDVIDCAGHYDSQLYWLYAIGCVLAIYMVCTIIDWIRIKSIETPLLNATENICMKVWHHYHKD